MSENVSMMSDGNNRAYERELLLSQNWRKALQDILADPEEARRLVEKTNISAMTLTRWITGETSPRKANLHNLVMHLRIQDQKLLLPLLQEAGLLEETEFVPTNTAEAFQIPAEFYNRVCQAVCSTSASLRAWSICQLVLRQCAVQLASEAPLMASILTLTPPLEENPVRSLREMAFINSQENEVHLTTRFLQGAESLTGTCITTLQVENERPPLSENTESFQYICHYPVKSAAAAPLLRSGQVAGALLLLSSEPSFFSQFSLDLIHSYASLAALAFTDIAFYDRSQISLELMPPPHQAIISTVKQRVIMLMRQSGPMANSSQQRAEGLAWYEVENENIALAHQQFDLP